MKTKKIPAIFIIFLLLFCVTGCDSSTPDDSFLLKAIDATVVFNGEKMFSGHFSSASAGCAAFTVDSPESIKELTFDYKDYICRASYKDLKCDSDIPDSSPVVAFFRVMDDFRKGSYSFKNGKYTGQNASAKYTFTLKNDGFISQIFLENPKYTITVY